MIIENAETERLKAEVARLQAERDAVRSAYIRNGSGTGFLGPLYRVSFPDGGHEWFYTWEEAVSAFRKGAGLANPLAETQEARQ